MTEPGGSHADLDALADHAEGLLDDETAARLTRHLDDCPSCRQRAAAIAAVRTKLAALPAESMPPDVATQVTRRLAAAADAGRTPIGQGTTVVPMPRLRRVNRVVLGAAAACIVLLAVVTAAVVALNGSSTSPTNGGSRASAGAAGAGGSFVVSQSGTNYRTRAALAAAVSQILAGTRQGKATIAAPSAAAGAGAAGTAGTAGTGNSLQSDHSTTSGEAPLAAQSSLPPLPAKLLRLKNRQALLRCAATQLGEPVGQTLPLGVDLGYWNGRPAAVLVLPEAGHADRVAIYVVSKNCSVPLVVELNVPRPAP